MNISTLSTINFNLLLSICLFFLLLGCGGGNGEVKETKVSVADSFLMEFEDELAAATSFLKNRDLDGDGKADDIYFEYTQGAHCCYLMSLRLSSADSLYDFPFEMDGGYVFGMPDGSLPEHFDIRDFDGDGRDEIFMEIFTYNGRPTPPEPEWTEKWGIRTNYVLFDWESGELRISDYELSDLR